MAHILVVDDDEEILLLVKRSLEREGHLVDTACSVQDISLKKAQLVDLILLDVMMPGEDGFSFCSRIRDMVDCPILFVTARTEERDLVYGLGLGADDYLQKPFTISELRARVAAHLRREARSHIHTIRSGDFSLDLTGKQLLYQQNTVQLTKSQYAICAHLIQYAGQVFSKEQLYEAVFGFDGESDESVIVEHIKNTRAKFKVLGADPIDTVWGIGYRWKKERL
ncbi:MAG: response regulator transcription factor [Lachnospiraceae bacterium]